jgi:hypothetical protein
MNDVKREGDEKRMRKRKGKEGEGETWVCRGREEKKERMGIF